MAKGKTKIEKATNKRTGHGYDTLHELLILKLQSLYDVEQELVKTLPKMAKHASHDELRGAFEEHLEETKVHAERLEKALRLLNVQPKKEKGAAIRGIAEDGSWLLNNVKDPSARDAALIAAAQFAEHYEMAGYQSACEWARTMGHIEVAELLEKILEEEMAASDTLARLAQGGIDAEANTMETEGAEEYEGTTGRLM